MRKRFAILLIFIVFSIGANAGVVYKWTDADGVVHFSDQPRDVESAERIVMPGFPAPDPVKGSAEAERSVHDRTEEETQATEAAQRKEIRARNCEIAHQTLAHNQNISRMYRPGPEGEREFLTAEERDDLLRRSRKDIEEWCD